MAGCVDQIKRVTFAVLGCVKHGHGMSLDRNAAFALQVHVVEHLFAQISFFDGLRVLEQAISQGGFSMIDVRHNTKITNQ